MVTQYKSVKMQWMRKIVSREKVPGTARRGGFIYLATLDVCGHVKKMNSHRGAKTMQTHCDKCALGLVKG